MTNYFSLIEEYLDKGQSFAACVFPEESVIHFFDSIKGNELHNQNNSFVIMPESSGEMSRSQRATSREEHRWMVKDALDAIANHQFDKVIISTIKHVERKDEPLSKLFERLISAYFSAFRYIVSHPEYGIWMGASPELLLKKEGNHYFTTSLAGTVKTSTEQPPHWNEKLIDEQAIVTNGIKTNLKNIGVNTLNISELKSHKAGPVTHLKTDIDFFTDIPSEEIISTLHPTAAVCGFPREKAKEFYRYHEAHSRRLYTGYIAVKNTSGDFNSFVNLRCMQVFTNHFELYVGGGITAASSAEEEWQETENKAAVLKKVIG